LLFYLARQVCKSAKLSADDQGALFLSVGYDDVQIIEDKKKGWICATGRKACG
jgi:hypothetical protein